MNIISKSIAAGSALAMAVALQAGCVTHPNATGPASPTTTATAPASPQMLTGTVAETLDSGGYTYILLENDGKKNWAAIPPAEVQVGQRITLKPGMEMPHFTSKTLNRTFDSITFSNGLVADATPAGTTIGQLPQGHPPIISPVQTPAGQPATKEAPAAADQQKKIDEISSTMPKGHKMGGAEAGGAISGKVVETMNGGGYTYIRLENEGKKTWAAVPATKVTVGQQLELGAGMEMTNFTSKALNRTFESIVFSGGVITK